MPCFGPRLTVLAPIEREADNHPILRESDCMYQMDLQRAERCANDRQLGEAEKICESVLAEHPDNVEALRIMAGVRLRQ